MRAVPKNLKKCYEDIQDRLHSESAPIDIGVAVLQWYCDEQLRVPSQAHMRRIILTYTKWLKKN